MKNTKLNKALNVYEKLHALTVRVSQLGEELVNMVEKLEQEKKR